ncbi:hypothetical protein BH20ACT2_BH20ACT2_10230 [soil metagenome]
MAVRTAPPFDGGGSVAPGSLPVDTVHPGTGDGAAVVRFDRTERLLHHVNAAVFGVLLLTAAALYIGPLSAVVGRRELVKDVHVVVGLAMPAPLLLAYAGRWRAGLRRDARRLARWIPDDGRWLRSRGRDRRIRLGKFNAGQKLNATLIVASIPIMLATGSIMFWFQPFPLAWRTGATFVHDWLAIVLFFAIAGHILKALVEPEAMRSMRTGSVPLHWAERHRPRWHAEVTTAESE